MIFIKAGHLNKSYLHAASKKSLFCKTYCSQSGLSLIEIFLVLILVAIFLMLGFRQYQNYTQQKNVIMMDNSVKILLTGAKKYYYANCKNAPFTSGSRATVPLSTIVGYIANQQLIEDPFKQDLDNLKNYKQVTYIKGANNTWVAQVEYTFPSSFSTEFINTYAAKLMPDNMTDKTFYWIQNLAFTGKGSDTDFTPLMGTLNQFSQSQTVKPGFDTFKPSGSQNPCD